MLLRIVRDGETFGNGRRDSCPIFHGGKRVSFLYNQFCLPWELLEYFFCRLRVILEQCLARFTFRHGAVGVTDVIQRKAMRDQ